MPLIGALTQAVASTVGSPLDYNSNFESIRAAFDDSLVMTDVARTITVQHTFDPPSAQPPFAVGANAVGQVVVGLIADSLDGVDPAVVLSRQIVPPGVAVSWSDLNAERIPFRVPMDGWLGVPVMSFLTAPDTGDTVSLRIDDSAITTITLTDATIDANEFDTSTAAGGPHVYTGVDQADAQVSEGDILYFNFHISLGDTPNDDGEGLIVHLPIYGENPHD